MALAPKSSARTIDVLQKRLGELKSQRHRLNRRRQIYQNISNVDPIEQLAAIKAHSLQQRFQYAFFASSGAEHRAALLEQIQDLPPTSSGIANKPFTTKIGIISDLFLYKSFEGLADFKIITPDNFRQHGDIDVLLLVSTWRGIDGSAWQGVTSRNNEKRAVLFDELIPFYRELDIPIVFYSKEDPPNYIHFVPFAQQADYIFTSAAEVIPKYEKDCPNAKSIDVLPFGINPKHHSPLGSQRGDVHKIVPFAGSWFNHKYKDRGRWGSAILDAVMAAKDYELVIFDRNSDLQLPRYQFPNRYGHALTPQINHQHLLDIQRVVDIGINLNSVSESASMFANRAIELQAQGTFVLSNYNVGLNSKYPHVHMSNGFTDTLSTLDSLSEAQIRATQAAGIRAVFSHDLAIMRIAKILQTVGLEADVTSPRVAILTHDTDEQLHEYLANQSYDNIIGIVDVDDQQAVDALSEQADIVAHVDTAHEYDPTHVEDLVNAFRYTDAVTVEKLTENVQDGNELARHSYTEPQNVRAVGAEYTGQVPPEINTRPGYLIDEVGVRRRSETTELSHHDGAGKKPPIISVVIPIYNNGPHLLHKCITSLRRSSIFDRMELVMVDDGSTDIDTIHAINALEKELEWVQVYRYEPGGSGSASRPRNKGLELASCDYITYLDPDNEALNDAYVKLLHAVIENNVDFAVGNMTRWRGTNSTVNYTKFLQTRLGMDSNIGHGGAQALVDMEFMPISIQALVARTQWLRDIGITQPVGAVGQDSYFFQQMLYYADTFATVNVVAHTYYAQVENSVVNTINAKFFKKYLPLEQARSEWLTDIGLLEEYRQTRMETFFTGWYLRKLKDVPSEQRADAIATIMTLGQMYGQHEWQSEDALAFWEETVQEIQPATSDEGH